MSRISDTGDSAQGADIKDKAQAVGQNLRDLGSQVRDVAKEKYGQVSDQARDYYEQGRNMATEWEQGIESYVQQKPVQALLMAAGVGLLLGVLWKRS